MRWQWLKSKNGKYLYASHNPTVRADLNGNVYGGGCFGAGSAPSFNVPQQPRLPTAEELYNQALSWTTGRFPLAMGARESAYADLARGLAYYQEFAPTSIEQALADRHFSNIMPDIEKSIRHSMSLSGMAHSPALAGLIATEKGKVGYDVGRYLSDLANMRAGYSLQSRLAMDPMQIMDPYVRTGGTQSSAQAEYDWDAAMATAQADYAARLEEYEKDYAMASFMSRIIPGGALIAGEPEMAAQGTAANLDMLASFFGMQGNFAQPFTQAQQTYHQPYGYQSSNYGYQPYNYGYQPYNYGYQLSNYGYQPSGYESLSSGLDFGSTGGTSGWGYG